jgi:hypothetical protein
LVIRQGPQAWFVPLCEENTLHQDTAFFKIDLVVAQPLNTALRGLVLQNRPFFLTSLFAHVFAERITRANYTHYSTVLDAPSQAYLRTRVDSPQRYYYLVSGGGRAIWEFDDTQPGRLQARIIQPTRYECFSM